MRNKYINVSRFSSRLITYRLVAFVVVIMTAIASVLGPVTVARADPISNFFGAVPASAQDIDVYVSTTQTTQLFENFTTPVALSDMNLLGEPNAYFIETGYISDYRFPLFDPNRYPYASQQDGPFASTYHDYVDKTRILSNGPYEFKVLHTGTYSFQAYFCPGSPPVCSPIGSPLYSTSHNNYLYAAAGYESFVSTKFKAPLVYTHGKFRHSGSATWWQFCPWGFSPLGAGTAYAIITRCTPDGMNGSNFQIVPASMAWSPFARS